LKPAPVASRSGLATVLFAVGWQLCLLAAAMLLPMAVDLANGHPEWQGFLASTVVTFLVGSLLLLSTRGIAGPLPPRGAFLLTTLSWLAAVFFGALPFQLGDYDLSLTDAVFETVSGLTTTGATVLVGLDTAPPGLLLWRSLLHALGGVGIIVMAIMILPFLQVGGMQLFRSESSDRSEKLLPSIASITQQIVLIYLVLFVACTMLLIASGMGGFDAVNHAFSTVSTGGFSTKDASVGAFANPMAEWVIMAFMLAAALPFSRYVAAVNGRPEALFTDTQIRFFLGLVVVAVIPLTLWLILAFDRPPLEAFRRAAFNAISVITTTGFATEDYLLWGPPAIALFLALTVVGGCTGSTAGGIKAFRFEILWITARMALQSLFMPNRVMPLRYAGRPIESDIILAVLSFLFFFMGSWGLFTVVLGALGLDLVTAISAAATALANVGPGLSATIGPAGNFQPLPDSAKWVLSLAMLLGRLEFFTVLVLLHPAFWRR
jgi:trk system potassium uptake protein TrkH